MSAKVQRIQRSCDPIDQLKLHNALDSIEMKTVKDIVTKRYIQREKALNDLMRLSVDNIDMNFISNFYQYFFMNNPELCNLFSSKAEIVGKGKAGIVQLLTVDDVKYIIKAITLPSFQQYLSLRIITPSDADKYMNIGNKMNLWKFKGVTAALIAVGGNDFVNQTCIHLILNAVLQDSEYYIHQYDAFFCFQNSVMYGYNIIDLANKKSLYEYLNETPITDDLLMDIITQICTPLAKLKTNKYSFVHADLKTKNIFVNENKNKRIIFKIADYDKSSIFWNGVRFHNNTYDYDIVHAGFNINQLINVYLGYIIDLYYNVLLKLKNVL